MLKPGIRKAGIFKTRSVKSQNLSNPEWEKPESLKLGMRKPGIRTTVSQTGFFEIKNGKAPLNFFLHIFSHEYVNFSGNVYGPYRLSQCTMVVLIPSPAERSEV